MTLICTGAFVAGLLMAAILPFLPFAASLVMAILIGVGLSLAQGMTVGETLPPALAILLACQGGYGLGLIAVALAVAEHARFRRRRGRASDPSSPVKHLRPDRK